MDVVAAAAPYEVRLEVAGPLRARAAAGGQLAVPAGAGYGHDDPGGGDGVGERRLSGRCGRGMRRDNEGDQGHTSLHAVIGPQIDYVG